MSEYNAEISKWEDEITKADDKIFEYNRILEEGKNKITTTRYLKSIFYKLTSEKTKQEVNLDTLSHRVRQFQNTLGVIKNQYSEYKKTMLVEMNY